MKKPSYKESSKTNTYLNQDSHFKFECRQTISYDIASVSNLFDPNNLTFLNCLQSLNIFCIIDNNVKKYYLPTINEYLARNQIVGRLFFLDANEHNKTLTTVEEFAKFCFEHGISRRDPIVCIGGGIVCDIGGMCANLIRRSTPCIKIPTTLMGMIDAAIGVKTGINFANRKNSLGTYFAPQSVLLDMEFLRTLPIRQIRNGLVEMAKIVALKDLNSWNLLDENLKDFLTYDFSAQTAELINLSIRLMLEELQSNPFEKDLKRIVDYGHEFGHLIEIETEHSLLHGEAVGIGMLISNCIALHSNLMEADAFDSFLGLYQKLKIPIWHEKLNSNILFHNLDSISKHKGGALHLVCLRKIGHPIFVETVELEAIEFAVNLLRNKQLGEDESRYAIPE